MMEINATLLVQIVNFFITYIILCTLFLRPAISEINHIDSELQQLQDNIYVHNDQLKAQHTKRVQLWQVCQEYFQKHKPEVYYPDRFIFKHISPSIVVDPFTTNELEYAKEKATERLIKAVKEQYGF